MLASNNQPGDMGNVSKQESINLIGNCPKPLKVDNSRIRAGAGDDQFRSVFGSKTSNLRVIDESLCIKALTDRPEIISRD